MFDKTKLEKKTHLKNPAHAMSHLVFFSFWGRQARPG
jgi:hypothetical protein